MSVSEAETIGNTSPPNDEITPLEVPELVKFYMKTFGMWAVCVVGPSSGSPAVIMDCRDPETLPPAARVLNIWWCHGRDEARRVAERASKTADHGRGDLADAVHRTARALSVALTRHDIVVAKAGAAVEAVTSRVDELNASGALRDFNRAYKRYRAGQPPGAAVTSYAEALRHLKRTALRDLAARVMYNMLKQRQKPEERHWRA